MNVYSIDAWVLAMGTVCTTELCMLHIKHTLQDSYSGPRQSTDPKCEPGVLCRLIFLSSSIKSK